MKTRTGTVAVVVELGSADRDNLARGHEPVIRNKQNETKYANANEQKAKYERWSALVPYCQDCGF